MPRMSDNVQYKRGCNQVFNTSVKVNKNAGKDHICTLIFLVKLDQTAQRSKAGIELGPVETGMPPLIL